MKHSAGYWLLLFIITAGNANSCVAQSNDSASIFRLPIQLDSFVVRSGFDVNAFIRRVRADTTFYKAFKSLHLVPYTAQNDFKALDKAGNITATWQSTIKQNINNHCRTAAVLHQESTGDFYDRNNEYNYYTAELFDYLFFAKKPVCNETDIVGNSLEVYGKGKMEKSKYELKQLIFNPGAKVSGVPFMGSRASIFDEGEAEKYDFKITQETYNGEKCYVFRITPKKGYEHKTLYDELTTWFRKGDYSILARNYSLSYHTLVYDFDVHMKVRITQMNGKLYPAVIDYDGNWHIFTRKRERVKFKAELNY